MSKLEEQIQREAGSLKEKARQTEEKVKRRWQRAQAYVNAHFESQTWPQRQKARALMCQYNLTPAHPTQKRE